MNNLLIFQNRNDFFNSNLSFSNNRFLFIKSSFFNLVLLFILGNCTTYKFTPLDFHEGRLEIKSISNELNNFWILRGDWHFFWMGDLISETKSSQSGSSQEFRPAIPWNEPFNGNFHNSIGYGAYKLSLNLPKDSKYSIKLKDIHSSFTVCITSYPEVKSKYPFDDKPILFSGNEPLVLPLPPGNSEILIIVNNQNHRNGGITSFPEIAEMDVFKQSRYENLFIQSIVIGGFLILSIYHLVLFSRKPTERNIFYFSILCFLISIRAMFTDEVPILIFLNHLNFKTIYTFELLSIYLLGYIFTHYIQEIFPLEFKNKVFKFIGYIYLALSVLVLVSPTYLNSFTVLPFQFLNATFILLSFPFLILTLIKKREGSKLFLTGILIFYTTIGIDSLSVLGWIPTNFFLSTYGLIFFIFAQSFYLSSKLSFALKRTEYSVKLSTQKQIEFQELNNEIEILDSSKDILIANLSKELKEPFHQLMEHTDSLQKFELPVGAHRYSSVVLNYTNRLEQILSDLILSTELDTGYRRNDSEFSLYTVFDSALFELRKKIESSFLNIEMNLPYELRYTGDKILWDRAISAVLRNAVQFNRKKGYIKIFILPGDNLSICITDSGIGIPQEILSYVTKKFYSFQNILTEQNRGFGLGLYLFDRILSLHNEKYTIRSSEKGTDIIIHLQNGFIKEKKF
ncbi:MAG: sensor histidine kinase [Leptospiraceae bacterium]|nr:sensor histidine kinase [Leptospiraceae bacterium]MCP5512277.1 sensor histidine kinase [Leptospiraceae bacterium]